MIRISRIVSTARYLRVGIHNTPVTLSGVKGLELRMPALSPTMSAGTIIKWLKKEGDPVSPGDALCEIQTDKAVMTFDTEEEGTLAKIMLPDDSKDVSVGTLIAMMVQEGQDWKDVRVPIPTSMHHSVEPVRAPDHSETSKVTLGPAVKKLLLEFGLDRTAIVPSGPRGTLLKGDVLQYVVVKKLKAVSPTKPDPITHAAIQSKPAVPTIAREVSAVFVDVPNSRLRRTLAAGDVRSKTGIPHSYCSVDCQVDEALQLGRTLRVTLEDYIVKAAAVALQRVPAVNAKRTGEDVQRLTDIDVALAVRAPDGPRSLVIRDAIGLGVAEISELVRNASKGTVPIDERLAVPLTISNLGSFGVTEFAEIVPEHRTAVLAVGTSRVAFDDAGRPCTRLTATLSYDARVFDEEVAAKFLEEFAVAVGNPSLVLLTLGPSPVRAAAKLYTSRK